MTATNTILNNAAHAGFTAGVYMQSADMGTAAATYADIAAAASQFAAYVTAGIPVGASPTAPIEAQFCQALLLQGICFAKTRASRVGESLPDPPPDIAMSDLIAGVISAFAAGQATLLPT